MLIRRDVHDHILVRFLPLVNDVLASLEDLPGLVSMAHLIDAAQKNSGYVSVTSTKVSPYLILGCEKLISKVLFFLLDGFRFD